MTTDHISIGLVEDQDLFRKGIKAILEQWPRFQVVFEAADGFSVEERLAAAETVPDVMFLDLSLPPHGGEPFNGDRVLEMIRERYPDVKCIMLSVHNDPYIIAQLIEQGANGYLLKDCDPQDLHDAIVSVYETGSYINAFTLDALRKKMTGKVRKPKEFESLSGREVEVLKLICQQKTAREIAEELFISEKTVNGHRNNLLQKTGSKNVTGLVMYAVKHRLVELI